MNSIKNSLYDLVKPDEVRVEDLGDEQPVLEKLQKILIGAAANSGGIIGIWKPALDTYNTLFPNLFGLPNLIFKKVVDKSMIGFAAYVASKTAGAKYCATHTYSFALRRGLKNHKVTLERQAVVAEFARSLSAVPTTFNYEKYQKLHDYFSKGTIRNMAYAVVQMGLFNKITSLIGFPIEDNHKYLYMLLDGEFSANKMKSSTKEGLDSISSIKSDDLTTYLSLIKAGPKAASFNNSWLKGIPNDPAKVCNYLLVSTGYSFPILRYLPKGRELQAIVASLKKNMDATTTKIGFHDKCLASLVFVNGFEDDYLMKEITELNFVMATDSIFLEGSKIEGIMAAELPSSELECEKFTRFWMSETGLTRRQITIILIAKAASYTPTNMNAGIVSLAAVELKSDEIIELTTWLGLLQLLHRLYTYLSVVEKFDFIN